MATISGAVHTSRIIPNYTTLLPLSNNCLRGRQSFRMVKLHMGVYAGIAAGGVMVLLVLLPIFGCLFSRSKKTQKAALEEPAAEKGEVVYSAPISAPVSAPLRPVNAVIQKPSPYVSQKEVGSRSQSSIPSMSPSYQSQASTVAPQSPLRNSTPSPPHMQSLWVKPSP